MSPNCWTATPEVPGWLEMPKGVSSCQHWRIDLPLAAAIAVSLRGCRDAGFDGVLEHIVLAKKGRMDRRMAKYIAG